MNIDEAEIDRKLGILHQQYITQEMNKLTFLTTSHEREIVLLWGVMGLLIIGVVVENVRLHRQLERLQNDQRA